VSMIARDFEAAADGDSDNVYDYTLTVTDADGNTDDQAVAVTVENVGEKGEAIIDLGDYGTLIAPIQVEGLWYYYWDRSGDGTNADTGSLNGGVDYTTHNVLDELFNNDINGTTNTTVANVDGGFGTTDTYRYATLNGVDLALPTFGNSLSGIDAEAGVPQSGTAIQNNTTTDNPTYEGLLAVWDSGNGTSTGTILDGTPSGWVASTYWSATPGSAEGHAYVALNNGIVQDYDDTVDKLVALQVL